MCDPTAFYNSYEYLRPNEKRYGQIPVIKQVKPIVLPSLKAAGSYGPPVASYSGSPSVSYGGSYINNPRTALG